VLNGLGIYSERTVAFVCTIYLWECSSYSTYQSATWHVDQLCDVFKLLPTLWFAQQVACIAKQTLLWHDQHICPECSSYIIHQSAAWHVGWLYSVLKLQLLTLFFPQQVACIASRQCCTQRLVDMLIQSLCGMQAGAGLVADSVPEAEYEETVSKAAALGRAIDLAEQAFVDC